MLEFTNITIPTLFHYFLCYKRLRPSSSESHPPAKVLVMSHRHVACPLSFSLEQGPSTTEQTTEQDVFPLSSSSRSHSTSLSATLDSLTPSRDAFPVSTSTIQSLSATQDSPTPSRDALSLTRGGSHLTQESSPAVQVSIVDMYTYNASSFTHNRTVF